MHRHRRKLSDKRSYVMPARAPARVHVHADACVSACEAKTRGRMSQTDVLLSLPAPVRLQTSLPHPHPSKKNDREKKKKTHLIARHATTLSCGAAARRHVTMKNNHISEDLEEADGGDKRRREEREGGVERGKQSGRVCCGALPPSRLLLQCRERQCRGGAHVYQRAPASAANLLLIMHSVV